MLTHFFTHITQNTYNNALSIIKYTVFIIFFILLGITAYYIASAPYDHQHKEYTLLLYLHAPIAWTGLSLYIFNSLNAIVNIFFSNTVSIKISKAISFPALIFLSLTLFTGSIWGKNSWGTYWVWDARLTSVFVLFVFYLLKNIILKYTSDNDNFKLEILNILSFTTIPIIIFSVNIWHTLHQGSSIQSNSIAHEILTPVKLAALTLHIFAYIICFIRFTKIDK